MSRMPERLRLEMTDGSPPFELLVPEPADRPSCFAWSVHKAGSTLLERILFDACGAAGIPTLNLPSILVAAGRRGSPQLVSTASWTRVFREHGYAYFGFRKACLPPTDLLGRCPSVLLLRDPRDIAVSFYYSVAFSHTEQGRPATFAAERAATAATPIDAWARAMNWRDLQNSFRTYRLGLPAATTRVYRYEDIIFRKREWLADMLPHLGIRLDRAAADAIADRHDIRPEAERPDQHIRQVAPGNFRKHLAADTIAWLEREFAEWMTTLAYDRPLDAAAPLCISDQPGFAERFFQAC